MLKAVKLENFRGFLDHTITFRHPTIIVGENNAGKTTVVEALRLVATVAKRFKYLPYNYAHTGLSLPRRLRGVSPSLKNLNINFMNICYHYGSPPAQITALFEHGERIEIYLFPTEEVFSCIFDHKGQMIISKSQASHVELPHISILPQVEPLERHETTLSNQHVFDSIDSHLSPRHFRNQLHLMNEFFRHFCDLASESWPRLQVSEIATGGGEKGDELSLFVRDGDFVCEVGCMGHGLQIWLQTMWFLARTNPRSVVILDEPDVYLHADLQRKLIRLLRDKFRQVIVATHSIEIISEASPDNILIVNKKFKESTFTSSISSVQKIINNIGGMHNINLSRLSTAKKVIIVEGKDMSILKSFQDTLFPDSPLPFDMVPNMSIGGWGGWNYAIGSNMLLKNSLGENIETFCVLDRDYHTDDEIQARLSDATTRAVNLWIWNVKEIENLLILPDVIYRVIVHNTRGKQPVVDDVISAIDTISKELMEGVFDAISTEYYIRNRSKGVKYSNNMARERVSDAYTNLSSRIAIISGKAVISRLSDWSQRTYGVSLNAVKIAREFRRNEIPTEALTVVSGIEKNEKWATVGGPTTGLVADSR